MNAAHHGLRSCRPLGTLGASTTEEWRMKIAVGGKGGSGKTTIAGTLARVLAARGLRVVALDDDSNPNLALTVGLPAGSAAGISALPRDLLEERTDAEGQSWLELKVPVEEFIDRYGVPAGDNLTLLVMGQPSHGGSG
jgi:CO dehydrogenase maturation factor